MIDISRYPFFVVGGRDTVDIDCFTSLEAPFMLSSSMRTGLPVNAKALVYFYTGLPTVPKGISNYACIYALWNSLTVRLLRRESVRVTLASGMFIGWVLHFLHLLHLDNYIVI